LAHGDYSSAVQTDGELHLFEMYTSPSFSQPLVSSPIQEQAVFVLPSASTSLVGTLPQQKTTTKICVQSAQPCTLLLPGKATRQGRATCGLAESNGHHEIFPHQEGLEG
jgi:hypothetical protein